MMSRMAPIVTSLTWGDLLNHLFILLRFLLLNIGDYDVFIFKLKIKKKQIELQEN